MAANKVFWWDAPKGFKAVKARSESCNGCAYDLSMDANKCMNAACTPIERKDKQSVIFIKREHHA